MGAASLLLAVVVGVWNGEWFPSGRAEHRAAPEIEQAAIRAAGKMLREGLDRIAPGEEEGVVICLNEVRDMETADALCREIGRSNLAVSVVTGYRRRDRFDQQQDAILTSLPVARANWSWWKTSRDARPPRGYARADVVLSSAVTATVYAVHLKSNYGATTAADRSANRAKRTVAIRQLIDQERPKRGKYRAPVIVAGDFNADAWKAEFADEEIFAALTEAKFENVLAALPAFKRVTHPGRGKYGNSVLDYIYLRGLKPAGAPWVCPAAGISDHNPVFVTLDTP